MKRKWFAEEQTIGILREREAGAKTTNRRSCWLSRCLMLPPSASLYQKVVGPATTREAVTHLRAVMDLSGRRARLIAGADRKIVRYHLQSPADKELRGSCANLPIGAASGFSTSSIT